MVISIGTKYLY